MPCLMEVQSKICSINQVKKWNLITRLKYQKLLFFAMNGYVPQLPSLDSISVIPLIPGLPLALFYR